MKMVLARCTGKRNLRDQPLEENDAMKRTRVHAQRKFAQGAALSPVSINKDIVKLNGVPPSGDAVSAKYSGNHSEISEVLPSKRPNTEDFLTFLCFRNTSILPARLDFFGAASGPSSSKNSGSSRKSSNKAASRNSVSAKSEESSVKLTSKDKAATSKLSTIKQRYREEELLRKKKMKNAPKHAQRASAKRLQPLADRRKQAKTNPAMKRSLRNEMKLNKLEAIKKKTSSDRKDTPKNKEVSAVSKPSREVKKPVPLKSQVNNLKRTVMKKSLKSKAKRAPLNLRRGLRSGNNNVITQELNLKSKRLQVIRNRKAKLGADKKASSATESVKTTKRVSAPKAKNIGSDFSSEDDQPLIKKQRTKESNEKPTPSPKIVDAALSRPARKTKETASLVLEVVGKDTRSGKKPSDDQNETDKSQADTPLAKRNEEKEKGSKGKPETKTQVKEDTSKKEESKIKNTSKEISAKAKLKRTVIVKKNSVIANRTKKGKLLLARTRAHSGLVKRTLKQSKGVKTRRSSSLDAEESKKSEAEKTPASSSSKPESTATSTRSGKISSQANPPKKQSVDSVVSMKSKGGKGSKEKSNMSPSKSVPEKVTKNSLRSVSEKVKNSDIKSDGSTVEKSKKLSASSSRTDQPTAEKSEKPSASLTQAEPPTSEKSKKSSASLIQTEPSDTEKLKKQSTYLAHADPAAEKLKKPVRTNSPAAEKPKKPSASPTRTASPAAEKLKKRSASPTRTDSADAEKLKKPSASPNQTDSPAVEKLRKPSASPTRTDLSAAEKLKKPSASPSQTDSPAVEKLRKPFASPSQTDSPAAGKVKKPSASPSQTDSPAAEKLKKPSASPTRTDLPAAEKWKKPSASPSQTDLPAAEKLRKPSASPTRTDLSAAEKLKKPSASPSQTDLPAAEKLRKPSASPTRTDLSAAEKLKKPSASPSQTDLPATEKLRKPFASPTRTDLSAAEKLKKPSASPSQTDLPATEKLRKPSASLTRTDLPAVEKWKKPSPNPSQTDLPAAEKLRKPSASPTRTDSPAAEKLKKSSASPSRTDSPAAAKSKKPSANLLQIDQSAVEKAKKQAASLILAENSEKSELVTRNTRRGSVPSISPPPQLPKKNKPKDMLSESSSKDIVGSTESLTTAENDTIKKAQAQTPESTERKSENVTKTRNPVKSLGSKSLCDAPSSSRSDKIAEKKASEPKNSSKATKKEQTPTVPSRSRPISNNRLSTSSEEEIFTKNISGKKSVKTKAAKNKSDVNKLAKTVKASNKAEPKAKKLRKSENLKDTPQNSSSKKQNIVADASSSEDDNMEDNLNLAALKTNLSKKSNLSANDKEKNTLKSPVPSSKEARFIQSDKKDSNKNLVSDQTPPDKNTSKVTNFSSEPSVKKASNKHSSGENMANVSDSSDNQTKSNDRTPSPARKNRSKGAKANPQSVEKTESSKQQNLSSEDCTKVEKIKGQRVVAKLKEDSTAKVRKNSPVATKEVNRKLAEDNSLNILMKDKTCVKPSDKGLFAEDESKKGNLKVTDINVASNAARNVNALLSEDSSHSKNNLSSKQPLQKSSNDDALPAKSEASMSAPLKSKDVNPINLLDNKVLHSKDIVPPYLYACPEQKSNTPNPKESKSLERNDSNKMARSFVSVEQKSNTFNAKELNSRETKDSNKILYTTVSSEQKSSIFNLKESNTLEKKDSNQTVSSSVNPKEFCVERKESNKTVSSSVSVEQKFNLFNPKESNSAERKDSNKMVYSSASSEQKSNTYYPKVSNSLERKDLNKMANTFASTEQKSKTFNSKESRNADRKDSNKTVYSSVFMEQKSNTLNLKDSSSIEKKDSNKTVSGNLQMKDVNQNKRFNSNRFEPPILPHQTSIAGSDNPSNPKIINKFEANKKEVNVRANIAKSPTDSPKSQRNVDQALSRVVPEPTQEDLVASESLIKLSMSHVPFQSSLFGPTLKANNEMINAARSQSQMNAPLQNFERTATPPALLKNINTNSSLISSEKDGKFDFLKKHDNTISSSKNNLEAPSSSKTAQKIKNAADKNLLDVVSSQFRNEFPSPSNLKFSETVSSGNNVPHLQNAQQPSPSVNAMKQNRKEPAMFSQVASPILGTNNVIRFDGDSSFNSNQRGNRLQSKKVENAEMESAYDKRKNKLTNQSQAVTDNGDRSKSSNLKTEESKSKISSYDQNSSRSNVNEIKPEPGPSNLSSQRNSDKNIHEPQKEVKNNLPDSKYDEKTGARSRTRRQSMSKPSNTLSVEEGVDKKRSKSSSAAAESVSPPVQRRSTRIKEPSSPCRKSRSPSPPPQRVLRARKSTYFGEVDSSDEDDDFDFLIASGKLFSESDASSNAKARKDDKNVNKDTAIDKKSDERKLVLSKRNNVAESKTNVKAPNQDSTESRLQEGLSDSTPLKKIDNKNQDVDGAKSKLEQVSTNKQNSHSNKSLDVAAAKNTNLGLSDCRNASPNYLATSSGTSDSRIKSNLVSAAMTSVNDGYLKNTNARRHDISTDGSARPSKSNLYQSESCPPRTQNEQKPEASGTNRPTQVPNISDSKSINTQITNYLHFSPAKPTNDQISKPKSIPNNSPSSSNLNLNRNPSSTGPSCFTKETNALQTSAGFPTPVKETNIHIKPENKNVLAPNIPSNKISNIDTSMLPNNPRTYFNRSLAAAHFKSHSGDVNKNLFAHASNEKQVNQLLKPVNKEVDPIQASVEPPTPVPATKPQNASSELDKDTSRPSSNDGSVSEKTSPAKESGTLSSADLSASWKNAFKNVKLPKPFPSVPKTPMDRNAWIKKHSAPLKLNKGNEQGGLKSDPFIIKSKPNDIFSANPPSTSSFSFDKPSNFDAKTTSSSSSHLTSSGSRDLSPQSVKHSMSPVKKIDNEKSSGKNIKVSNFSSPSGTPLVKDPLPASSAKSTENSAGAEESSKEPLVSGKHLNLPVCVEQTLKQNTLKSSAHGKKASLAAPHEKDTSAPENLSMQPVTSSHKQFVENPLLSDKDCNASRKMSNVNVNHQSVTSISPEKSPSKLAVDKSSSPSKFRNPKNPLSIENFIKPETSSKTSNNVLKSGIDSPHKHGSPPVEKKTAKKSKSNLSVPYDGINVGAEFFPEPQSQKPSYSSNPTLKKYSQSLSTSTRKSIDSEVDLNVSDTPPTPEGTPEKMTKKVIFQQRRMSIAKEVESPKKAVAFSPEHESSVYAFEPDLPPTSTPFRRNKFKSNQESSSNSNLDSSSASSNNSIAVQVNLETEAVFECSTQTDVEEEEENEGQLFYIPLQQSVSAPSPQIQGVAVKLGTEGPDQRVIMRAKLVTKPPSNYAKKTAAVATNTISSLSPLQVVSPEKRKVRPLGASSVDSSAPVGTVQPTSRSTSRDSPSPLASPKSTDSSSFDLSMPSTSSANRSPKVVKRGRKSAPQTSTPNTFPKPGSPGQIVEAPTFHPTEEEFSDPLEYIEQIRPMAEQFGLCRIVPPSNFKPECKVADDMRFIAYNQFVHRMLHRWGPSSKESAAIRKHLATENITLKNPPCIGGVELDLPQLYHKVQICGGLRKVMEQDRWQRVADLMKIPKSVHDRSSKLDEIYCKYLLPYDTLSTGERAKLFADVEKEWKHHKFSENELFEDIDDCIIKGRSMALNQFYRVARNIMTIHFGGAAADKEIGPDPEEVESQYWEHVSSGQNHICVHSASIDTGPRGYGFPTVKNSTFAKHNWNLKILTNNSGSVLRSLGPIIGVTVPTLHVQMLFTTCCWYRDPHGLPWIEYLHTGASKIWYGIPAEYNSVFRSAMSKLLPSHKRSDQGVWLASDTAMVPPPMLVENGVSLSRIVQQPGQFIVVFPRAFTSSIATGYLLSESVYFAPSSWLQSANEIFLDLQNSCESSIFSLEQLLCSIATDSRTSLEILTQVAPLVSEMRDREVALRSQLEDLGLRATERLPRNNKRKSQVDEEEDYECETCHANLYISLVSNSFEEVNYCLCHGIELLSKKRNHLKYCKLQYAYTEEELEEIIVKLNERIEQKSQKKPGNKSSGSTPTK